MIVRAVLRGLAPAGAALAAVLGGIGWLYLLRRLDAPLAGPRLDDALPLERLAGGGAQPLARVALAWLPAGLVAGTLLAGAGFARRAPRAALLFAPAALLLMGLGALSDAITASDPLRAHLADQPGRAAIWAAAGLLAAGAAVPRARAPR